MIRCKICERQFNPEVAGEEMCNPCILEEQARIPPQELQDMRWVAEGNPARTASQVKFKEMFEQRFDKFLVEKRAAERDYRTHLRELAGKAAEPKDAPAAQEEAITQDEGQERLAELLAKEWQLVSDYLDRAQGTAQEPGV